MGIRQSVLSLLPLLMLLQACDGTPFGQRLSESFDSQPGETSPAVSNSDSAEGVSDPSRDVDKTSEPDQRQVRVNDKSQADDKNNADVAADEDEKSTQPQPAQQLQTPTAAVDPDPTPAPEHTRPYRIIIRLSASDPAAPAEGVTDALRRAGIGFEVETIEKVPVGELNQPPNLQPKPAS